MRFPDVSTLAPPKIVDFSATHLFVLVATLIAFIFLASQIRTNGKSHSLRDPIPGIFNAAQFVFNNHKFMVRVQNALQDSNIVRFYLGNSPIILAVGPQSIRAMFGRELVHHVTNQEQMTRFALPTLYRMNRDEVRRWEADKSGVTKVPIPGTESTPPEQRLWFNYEHIYAEYLGKPQYMRPLVEKFKQNLGRTLQRYPTDKWTTVSIQDICRHEVAESAVNMLFGPNLIKLTPDFIDRFWDFDEHVFKLIAVPKWINSTPFKAHNHFLAAIETWLDDPDKSDWKRPGAEADWEPCFGGRAVRELVTWMRNTEWRKEVIAATLGALAFALTSNTIPTTIWMLMEMIKDPSLLQAVRDEVATAMVTDPTTGERTLDSQKLVALPLLQSIFTETLRLQISFNITRDVKQPILLDGHAIAKGSILQAPMMVSHYDESAWGVPDHPATDFWAERHIKYTSETDESGKTSRKRVYALAGHTTSYFPFGGGANMCPGRHLSKYEIFVAIGLLVSQFDIELVGWTKADGSPSDRPAKSDLRYCGAGAMPPDRDMQIKLRRIAK